MYPTAPPGMNPSPYPNAPPGMNPSPYPNAPVPPYPNGSYPAPGVLPGAVPAYPQQAMPGPGAPPYPNQNVMGGAGANYGGAVSIPPTQAQAPGTTSANASGQFTMPTSRVEITVSAK